jgi:ABC-type phosphate transport system auxiliary subunit
MKCDELKAYKGDVTIPVYGTIADAELYLKDKADAAIAELKDKCQMHDFFWEGCGFAKRGFKNTIAVSEAFDRLEAENAELKAENERLNYALDKERSETIKYMDGLSNAKNEIERLTIDKRNAELRENVADATVEKLKAETAELKQKLEDVNDLIKTARQMLEDDEVHKSDFYKKWKQRWLELAEKFKEAT